MTQFSVAICTFRRAHLLPTTLSSLASVQRPDVDWELLLIDNGCEPNIRDITRQFSSRLPIRYQQESSIGIAHARNRAVHEAASPYLLFADDDVLFDSRWLCAMINAIRKQPHCDFWGGRIVALWEVERPGWFDLDHCPSLGDSVVKYDLGDQSRPWNPDRDPPFYTANLALRLEAVRRAGLFDTTLGHRGNKRGSGEDSWMIKSIVRNGGQGWYAADALLQHPVEPARLTKPYARRFAWRQGRISVEMLRRESNGVPRWLYRLAVSQIMRGFARWIMGCCRRNAGLAFAGQYQVLFNFSKLWHACGKR